MFYIVREAIGEDLKEITTLLKQRHGRFIRRLSVSLLFANWISIIKYTIIGLFACYHTGYLFPIICALLISPICIIIELIYSSTVTHYSMKTTAASIENRVQQGLTPQHKIFVVRRVGELVGVISLRDMVGNNICLECEFFFCNERNDIARKFVLEHTLKIAFMIAEQDRYAMLLFRCCDIFPEIVISFEKLEFELIMIHRVLILFSSIHMLTFAKVTNIRDDDRTNISVHIPGLTPISELNPHGRSEPIRATSSNAPPLSFENEETMNAETPSEF